MAGEVVQVSNEALVFHLKHNVFSVSFFRGCTSHTSSMVPAVADDDGPSVPPVDLDALDAEIADDKLAKAAEESKCICCSLYPVERWCLLSTERVPHTAASSARANGGKEDGTPHQFNGAKPTLSSISFFLVPGRERVGSCTNSGS